jgi:hypothetical protein
LNARPTLSRGTDSSAVRGVMEALQSDGSRHTIVWICIWMLGLVNNVAYVVVSRPMLIAGDCCLYLLVRYCQLRNRLPIRLEQVALLG